MNAMAKKWADGERNIRKRKGGCWEGRYTAGHDLEAGKPIYKNVLGRTQGEANPKAAIEEIKGLDVTMMGKYIVGAWMDKWFKNYAKIKVRSSSHHAYQGYIDNHIKPDIGEVPLENSLLWNYRRSAKNYSTVEESTESRASGSPGV